MQSEQLYKRDEKILADCMKIRLYPITMKKASGSTITDLDDKDYIDFSANWAVANTGYSHPKIQNAVNEQMKLTTFATPATVVTEPTVALAERIAEESGAEVMIIDPLGGEGVPGRESYLELMRFNLSVFKEAME